MRNKLLIIKVKALGRYFIYHTNTNRIIETDRITNMIIDYYTTMSKAKLIKKYRRTFSVTDIEKAHSRLKRMISKKQLLIKPLPHRLNVPSKKTIYRKLNHKISHFSFFVANSCNLACRYCFLRDRPHASEYITDGKKLMDKKTARLGVEFLAKHSSGARSITISFSGGEPLLNFETIKYIVKLAKMTFKCKELDFNITTNATMLDEDIIRYLIKNHFVLLISLDGPPEINDRYRISTSGRPTSRLIENKVNMVRRISEDFFLGSVDFLSTHDSTTNILPIYDYFRNKYGKIPSITTIQKSGSGSLDYHSELAQRRSARMAFERLILCRSGLNDRIGDDYNIQVYANYFYNYLKQIINRKIKTIGHKLPLNAMCIPGEQASVAPDGKLYVCYQLTHAITVGDLKNGFDYNKSYSLLCDYGKMSSEECSNCWAARLCNLCLYSAYMRGHISLKYKRYHCKIFKGAMSEALKIAIMLACTIDDSSYKEE